MTVFSTRRSGSRSHKIALDPNDAQRTRFAKAAGTARFALDNGQCILDGSRIRLPHPGWVRIRETLRFPGKILAPARAARRARSRPL